MVKRISSFFISLFIVLIIFPIISFSYTDSFTELLTSNEYPPSITVGNKVYVPNEDTYNSYHLIVYGVPHGNISAENQRQYLGWNMDGIDVTNDLYFSSASAGQVFTTEYKYTKGISGNGNVVWDNVNSSTQSWKDLRQRQQLWLLTQNFYDDDHISANFWGSDPYSVDTGYTLSKLFNTTDLSIIQTKALIQVPPDPNVRGSVRTFWHSTRADGTYKDDWNTLIFDELHLDYNVSCNILTSSNTYNIPVGQDYIDIPITVTSTVTAAPPSAPTAQQLRTLIGLYDDELDKHTIEFDGITSDAPKDISTNRPKPGQEFDNNPVIKRFYRQSIAHPNGLKIGKNTVTLSAVARAETVYLGDFREVEGEKILTITVDGITLALTPTPTPIPSGNTGNTGMSPSPSAVIKADIRGSEKFNVTQGIPSSEKLYINAIAKNYIFDYQASKFTGSSTFPIYVTKQYHKTWQTDEGGYGTSYHIAPNFCTDTNADGINDFCPGHYGWISNWVPHTADETVTQSYNIIRNYGYWQVDKLSVMALEKVVINNQALPGSTITITPEPSHYTAPTVSVNHSTNLTDHINNPIALAVASGSLLEKKDGHGNVLYYYIDLGNENWSGSSAPYPDWNNQAESAVPPYTVNNDNLVFNGNTIMSNALTSTEGSVPGTIPESPTTGQNVFYVSGQQIDPIKPNNTYASTGTIYYHEIIDVNSPYTSSYTKPITNINSVIVHTPVVCQASLYDDSAFNQELTLDSNRTSIVLGRSSNLSLVSNGTHRNIMGYGTRDFEDYTKGKQIRFPFPIYVDTTYQQTGRYLASNTWYSIPLTTDSINFYTPSWVQEGNYSIDFREIAINTSDLTLTETGANLNPMYYVASQSIPVRVSGRLYGFTVTDITDYQWETFFRTTKGLTSHTGKVFTSGKLDRNGDPLPEASAVKSFLLPIMPGKNDIAGFKSKSVKLGYSLRFRIDSVGGYGNNDTTLRLVPHFYHVSSDGSNRQEVNLYYSWNKNLIKIGDAVKDIKTITMSLSNPYRNVPSDELDHSGNLLYNYLKGINQTTLTQSKFLTQYKSMTDLPIGHFYGLSLGLSQRTYTIFRQLPEEGILNGLSTTQQNELQRSKQRWYGEYYLPADVKAVPYGIQPSQYRNLSLVPFLKEGYLVVHFDIILKTGSTDRLFYDVAALDNSMGTNPSGLSLSTRNNQWLVEGFKLSQKDNSNNTFQLAPGDVVLYHADKSSSDDFTGAGNR